MEFFQNFGLSGSQNGRKMALAMIMRPKCSPLKMNDARGKIVRHFSSCGQRNVKCCADSVTPTFLCAKNHVWCSTGVFVPN